MITEEELKNLIESKRKEVEKLKREISFMSSFDFMSSYLRKIDTLKSEIFTLRYCLNWCKDDCKNDN